MRKLEGELPNRDNTEYSGFADMFFSQWLGWLLSIRSQEPDKPVYCCWNGCSDEGVMVTTIYLIDYEQRSVTPVIDQDGDLYLDDERTVRYEDLFSKK